MKQGKIVPECPACLCNMFRLEGDIEVIVEITDPEGTWENQEVRHHCWPNGFPHITCADCGAYIEDEDMRHVIEFIAVNKLASREIGKLEKPHLARFWRKHPLKVVRDDDNEGGD